MNVLLKRLLRHPLLAVLIVCSPVAGLSQAITGKITDSVQRPLEGVTITSKGAKQATAVSDNNGNYSIQATPGTQLVFSSVGYGNQTVRVGTDSRINVVLRATSSQLSDVVVIGYGSRQKRDVTGAISSVNAADIEKTTATSPEFALQGKAAGVFLESGGGEPNARPNVRIRGVNTFGYSQPLYVVDGVPIIEGYDGAISGAQGDIRSPINVFSMINPGDIESISVLKDASASAIYGVRASNGVILITTKRGKTGKPSIDVNSYAGTQNIAHTLHTLNTQQYFDLTKEEYNNNPDANTGFGTKFGPLYDESSPQYVGNSPTYNWYDQLLNKNAMIQEHNVRVSGGTDALSYYFSGSYAKQESPLKANNLDRYTISANIESKFSKVVQAGLTIRMVDEHALNNTQFDIGGALSTIPFQPIFDPSSSTGYAKVASGSFEANPDYDPSLLNPGAPFNFAPGDPKMLWGNQTRFNAFAFQQLNLSHYELLRALGSAYVQVEPIKGLKIKGTLGGDYYINLRKSFTSNDAWEYSQTPGNPYASQDGNAKGKYGERQTRTSNLNKELTVNYNHTFAHDHNIDVILGASDQYTNFAWTDVSGNVNYSNPQYWAVNNIIPYTGGSAGILTEDQLLGYFGRISYKFKDKYYLDATYRYDGSSRLAPGHKWDGFPSIAAGWRISEENFFPKNSFVNDLKLRGGWGRLGNFLSASYYAYLSSVNFNSDYSTGSGNGDPYGAQYQGAALLDFANTSLTWEKVKETNAGFDAVLFNNHINFTAEYYNKMTYGIIQTVALPPNTGIQNPANLNVAEVRNSGIELQLGYTAHFGPVGFNVSGNITTVKNRVIKLNGGTALVSNNQRIAEGYSMNYLYGYQVAGIFQSQDEIDKWRQAHADANAGGQTLNDPATGYQYKPGDMYFQDLHGNPTKPGESYSPNPDSLVNDNDRTYLGKSIPGYYYGLTVGANYKGFDISIFFQGVGDVQKYDYVRASLEGMSGLANSLTSVLDRWTPDHPSSTMPRAVYSDPARANRYSSRWVENAGYVRLKNLQVGYTFPKSLLNRSGFIQKVRVYFGALNLLTVTRFKGLDPETDGAGFGLDPGTTLIPPTRQLMLGLNLGF